MQTTCGELSTVCDIIRTADLIFYIKVLHIYMRSLLFTELPGLHKFAHYRSQLDYVKPFHYRTLQLQVPGSTCDWLTVPVTGHIYSAVISWKAEVVAGSFSPQLFHRVSSHGNHYTTSSEINWWGC